MLLRHSFQLCLLLPSVSSSNTSLRQSPIIISNADNLLTRIQFCALFGCFGAEFIFSFSKLQRGRSSTSSFLTSVLFSPCCALFFNKRIHFSFACYVPFAWNVSDVSQIMLILCTCLLWMLHRVDGCWLKGLSQSFTSKSLFNWLALTSQHCCCEVFCYQVTAQLSHCPIFHFKCGK